MTSLEPAAKAELQHTHAEFERLRGTFGNDAFGVGAEKAARFFGTPRYIIGQSLVVVAWIVANAVAWGARWDPYPFILLNLAFSTQAAYAAPLILLAQTRQASRDQVHAEANAKHMEKLAEQQVQLIEENTRLTEEVHKLAAEVHAKIVGSAGT